MAKKHAQKVFSITLEKKHRPKHHLTPPVFKRIRLLEKVPPEVAFYLVDGRRLDSVLELVDALETMPEDIFRHHVNDVRNDFAHWITDIFREPCLGDVLKNCSDRRSAQVALLRSMVEKLKRFV